MKEELKNKPKDFEVYHHGVPQKESCFSWTTVHVVPELIGLPWNDLTMCYVLSLEPTAIRVSTGMVTCDGCTGRITVYVDDDNNISQIDKEVRIPCLPGANGYVMSNMLKKLKDKKITYDMENVLKKLKEDMWREHPVND